MKGIISLTKVGFHPEIYPMVLNKGLRMKDKSSLTRITFKKHTNPNMKPNTKSKPNADDFDYWSSLARRNPERFEEERRKMLAAFIDTAPSEQHTRLTRTQWKIDQVRSLAKNPYDALYSVSKLMWEELMVLNKYQVQLVGFFASPQGAFCEIEKRETAKVIQFKKRE